MSIKELKKYSFLYVNKSISVGEFVKLYREYKERS